MLYRADHFIMESFFVAHVDVPDMAAEAPGGV